MDKKSLTISKNTFRLISGATTIISTAAVALISLFNVPNAALINGIIVASAGFIDEICTLFIENNPEQTA